MSEVEHELQSRSCELRALRARTVISTLILLISGFSVAGVPGLRAAAESVVSSTSVPASCGAIGASAYQPEPVPIPEVDVSPRGRIITVTSSSDTIDGDVSSVQALSANPGPDGTSLREALEATNSDPGVSTINFSSSLQGATIEVSELPPIVGGDVLVTGDIDGDGRPDVTLEALSDDPNSGDAFQIRSSGNTLHAIALDGFFKGVNLVPQSTDGVYADNVISNLSMTNIRVYGILLTDWASRNRWLDTVIVGNTIEVDHSLAPDSWFGGIHLPVSADSSLERTTIANNTIRISRGGIPDNIVATLGSDAIFIWAGAGGSRSEAIDTLIAYNTIEMTNGAGADGDFGIVGFAGGDGGNDNLVDGLRIVENRITMPAPGSAIGIQFMAGSEGGYSERNVMKNVSVLGNTIEGPGTRGIDVGKPSGRNNRLVDVSLLGNNILLGPGYGYHSGILVVAGSWPTVRGDVSLTGSDNEASAIVMKWNTVRLVEVFRHADLLHVAAAVRVIGGQVIAPSNRVTDISIAKNKVHGGRAIGIEVLGGLGSANNRASKVTISCNQVQGGSAGGVGAAGVALVGGLEGDSNPPPGFPPASTAEENVVRDVQIARNSIKSPSVGIRLIGGVGSKSKRNVVTCITQSGNRIDAPKKISVRPNVDGATGNKVRIDC